MYLTTYSTVRILMFLSVHIDYNKLDIDLESTKRDNNDNDGNGIGWQCSKVVTIHDAVYCTHLTSRWMIQMAIQGSRSPFQQRS